MLCRTTTDGELYTDSRLREVYSSLFFHINIASRTLLIHLNIFAKGKTSTASNFQISDTLELSSEISNKKRKKKKMLLMTFQKKIATVRNESKNSSCNKVNNNPWNIQAKNTPDEVSVNRFYLIVLLFAGFILFIYYNFSYIKTIKN